MSYDIYLEVDTGAEDLTPVVEIGNYTSNVSPMWAQALGCRLMSWTGWAQRMHCRSWRPGWPQCGPIRPGYRELNPANGWGRYEGALEYLKKLRDACAEHPKTRIRVSH